MEIIPVLDLMGGQVVHARQGQRDRYRPVVSTLCPSAEPLPVLETLLCLHPFRTVYLADLDAILMRGSHDGLIETLARKFPKVAFWVDRGSIGGVERPNCIEVLGSESLTENWREVLTARTTPFVLSLDFGLDGFLGPRELAESSATWPETVILMTLQRVGARAGPDLELLENLLRTHPHKRFVAAGGVRDAFDLSGLQRTGAHGVLIASALHDGKIGTAELAEFV